MRAADGRMRLTDVADTEQLFRLIQSIPSPKAEPFKQWIASVTALRINKMQDPELDFEQAYADYRRHSKLYRKIIAKVLMMSRKEDIKLRRTYTRELIRFS